MTPLLPNKATAKKLFFTNNVPYELKSLVPLFDDCIACSGRIVVTDTCTQTHERTTVTLLHMNVEG